ncbi:MAG: hypothetical protein BWY82_00520 [Verrucomicrobia bacterium ADurb.Bin474]|nr:MAG: hypothetical protein BWY82_00520 [Verrucomicrobia bacterium ADurb.Bin474]
MSYPLKFKGLLEKEINDVELFEGAWITWAVCACSENACGWEGWILESVYKIEENERVQLPAVTNQICPICGKNLFRTGAQVKVIPDENQGSSLKPGIDYEVSPIDYEQ